MKKRLLLILTTFVTITSYAQIGFGTSFNFCSFNGVQYNPGWHPEGGPNNNYNDKWVTTYEDEDLSECEKLFLLMNLRDEYPGHTILGPATMSYNCHGYSHSIYQGGDTCNVTWYPELCINCFTLVQTPQPGDIAVVRDYTNYTHTEYELLSQHSSIVVNQDTLISKWGMGC